MTESDSPTNDQLIDLVHATRALGREGYERVELRFVHVGNYIEACVISVVASEELIDPLPDEVITLILQRRMTERDEEGAWMQFVLTCWMDGLVEEQASYDAEPTWLVGHPSSDDFELEHDRFPRVGAFPEWFNTAIQKPDSLSEPLVPEAHDQLIVRSPKARALSAEVGPEVMRLYHEALVRSLEVQEHVMTCVGDSAFDIDLNVAGTVRFTDANGNELTARAHILGESVTADGVWRWVWSLPDKYPAALADATHFAQFVRSYGEHNNVPGLTQATLPLNKVLPAHATALLLLAAAKPVTGAWAHFLAETEGGDSIAMLLSHPEFEVGRGPLEVAAQYALAAAKHLTVFDHLALIQGYAKHADDVVYIARDNKRVSWVAPEGEVVFTLNAAGQIEHAEFIGARTIHPSTLEESNESPTPAPDHVNEPKTETHLVTNEVIASKTATGWFGRWLNRM